MVKFKISIKFFRNKTNKFHISISIRPIRSKIRPDQIEILCVEPYSLRIRGHAVGSSLCKWRYPNLKGSWPWPWPWIGSYCIRSCVTHRPLPTCRISLKSKKHFVDGRTYGRTDGNLRPALLGWLCRINVWMVFLTTNQQLFIHC